MATNTPVDLSDESLGFIQKQISSGRFESPSQVVDEGLRLLEEQELRLERLRLALKEGLESGVAEGFDVDAWLEERRRGGARDEAA